MNLSEGSTKKQHTQDRREPEDDDDYLPRRAPAPSPPSPPAPRGLPGSVVIAIMVSSVAILLWFPVGIKYLQTGSPAPERAEPYKEWLLSSAKNTVASQMYRAASRLGRCIDANDGACACAVRMPDVADLAGEVSARWDDAGLYSAAHAALSSTVSAFQALQQAQKASCPASGGVASLKTVSDRYQTQHNAFVDAIERAESGK